MPDAPAPPAGRPLGEFKARLNRDIAFTIIDEQVRSGIDQGQLTGRGLAKQYGFGSPQTWVTHLKDWRQQHGFAAAPEEGVREAEAVEQEPAAEPPREEGGANYGVISRSEFLQHQEMWNRLLAEREQAHAERLKVARLEGENAGRSAGREEGAALAEARERMLDERVRRERLEGERAGEQRALAEAARRARGERWLLAILTFVLGGLGGAVLLWSRQAPPATVVPALPLPQPVLSEQNPKVTPSESTPAPKPAEATPALAPKANETTPASEAPAPPAEGAAPAP